MWAGEHTETSGWSFSCLPQLLLALSHLLRVHAGSAGQGHVGVLGTLHLCRSCTQTTVNLGHMKSYQTPAGCLTSPTYLFSPQLDHWSIACPQEDWKLKMVELLALLTELPLTMADLTKNMPNRVFWKQQQEGCWFSQPAPSGWNITLTELGRSERERPERRPPQAHVVPTQSFAVFMNKCLLSQFVVCLLSIFRELKWIFLQSFSSCPVTFGEEDLSTSSFRHAGSQSLNHSLHFTIIRIITAAKKQIYGGENITVKCCFWRKMFGFVFWGEKKSTNKHRDD